MSPLLRCHQYCPCGEYGSTCRNAGGALSSLSSSRPSGDQPMSRMILMMRVVVAGGGGLCRVVLLIAHRTGLPDGSGQTAVPERSMNMRAAGAPRRQQLPGVRMMATVLSRHPGGFYTTAAQHLPSACCVCGLWMHHLRTALAMPGASGCGAPPANTAARPAFMHPCHACASAGSRRVHDAGGAVRAHVNQCARVHRDAPEP